MPTQTKSNFPLFTLILVTLLMVLCALPAHAQENFDRENVRLVGRWAEGPSRAVAVQEDFAYFGNGGYLQIADVSDPADPTAQGRAALPALVEDVAVDGDYAYVGNGGFDGGLRIIDVSNSSNPEEVGAFVPDPNNGIKEVAVAGDYAYVAADATGLLVIDVSDPTNPQRVGAFEPNFTSVVEVTVAGDHAYVAVGGESYRLRVIDVSDPTHPQQVESFSTGDVQDIAATDNYVYIADAGNGLSIYESSNPASLKFAGSLDLESVSAVTVAEDHTYVAGGNGLLKVDVSNPANPQKASTLDTGGFIPEVAVAGGHAFLAAGASGLRIIDVSGTSDIQEVATFTTAADAQDVAVRDGYAYVADNGQGLRVLDVSNPADPQEVDALDAGGLSIAVKDGYAYAADGADGVRVIDISDPANPQNIATLDSKGRAEGVAVAGDYAYVAVGGGGEDGLRVVDVSDPSDPREVGFFDAFSDVDDPLGDFKDVAMVDSLAYVAVGESGMRMIDVSDPTSPQEVGFFDTGEDARKITMASGLSYLSDGADGLYVLEDTGLAAFSVKSVNGDGPVTFDATGVAINFSGLSGSGFFSVRRLRSKLIGTEDIDEKSVSTYRFVVRNISDQSFDSDTEVRFDVSTLDGITTPSDVTIYKRPRSGEGSFTALSTTYDSGAGELIATTGSFSEFVFASNTNPLPTEDRAALPQTFVLDGNAPNPFRRSTTIRYALPRATRVTLTAYDVLGRRVATLVGGEKQTAGRKRVHFEASGLSAGIYVVQMTASDFTATRKVVLVR